MSKSSRSAKSELKPSKKKVLNIDQVEEMKLKMQAKRKSLVDQGLERANWEEALKYRKKQSNMYEKNQKVSFFVSNDYFKQYGPGTYLFFTFADKLMKIFIIMSVISIPAIYSNYSGDGMSSIGASGVQSILMGFSFGNQLTNSTYYTTSAYQTQMKSHYRMIIIPDFIYSLMFLVFLFYWQYYTNKVVAEMKQQTQLPSYFCVTVQNVPESITQEQIRNYMEQFGEVKQVAEVRNYDQTINVSKKIYEKTITIRQQKLKVQSEINNQKIVELKKDIDQYYSDLHKYYFMGNVIMYFVSFKTIIQRDQTIKSLAAYSQAKHKSAICCGCTSHIPPNYLLEDKFPQIKQCAIQPGSIIWENIHLGSCSRFVRWILQTLLIVVASVLAFVALSFVNIAAPQSTTVSIDTSSYTYRQIVIGDNSTITEAWCLKQSPTEVYSSSDLLSLCSSYFVNYYSSLAIGVSISVGVVVVKLILQKLVYYISIFQRPDSYSQHTSSLTINYFCIYFVTTFILTILLQANIYGISFKYLIVNFLSDPYLISNIDNLAQYSDFTRSWYSGIGYKICITWIISSLVPHIYDPLVQWLLQKINQCRAKGQLIQKKMNQMINPKEFAFQEHYANMLLIVFGALVLGGPIPFLLIFATLALATKLVYWRIMFIRFSRIPPTFDQSLNNTILRILPIALILHAAVSIYAYGADYIFYENLGTNMSLPDSYYSKLQSLNTSSTFLTTVLQRMNLSFLMTVIGCLTVVVTIAKTFFYDSIKYLIGLCRKEEPSKLSAKMSVLMDQQKNFVTSYLIEKNQNYFQIYSILKSVEDKGNKQQLVP